MTIFDRCVHLITSRNNFQADLQHLRSLVGNFIRLMEQSQQIIRHFLFCELLNLTMVGLYQILFCVTDCV